MWLAVWNSRWALSLSLKLSSDDVDANQSNEDVATFRLCTKLLLSLFDGLRRERAEVCSALSYFLSEDEMQSYA